MKTTSFPGHLTFTSGGRLPNIKKARSPGTRFGTKTKHTTIKTRQQITGSTPARHLSDNAKSTTLHIKYKNKIYSDNILILRFLLISMMKT